MQRLTRTQDMGKNAKQTGSNTISHHNKRYRYAKNIYTFIYSQQFMELLLLSIQQSVDTTSNCGLTRSRWTAPKCTTGSKIFWQAKYVMLCKNPLPPEQTHEDCRTQDDVELIQGAPGAMPITACRVDPAMDWHAHLHNWLLVSKAEVAQASTSFGSNT